MVRVEISSRASNREIAKLSEGKAIADRWMNRENPWVGRFGATILRKYQCG